MYFNSAPLYIDTRNNYLSKKIISKAKKRIYLRGKFFYVRGISSLESQYFGKKKRRKPRVYGLSPLRWYKDNTFSARIQIALTFRNTLANVKMQRFAAARI